MLALTSSPTSGDICHQTMAYKVWRLRSWRRNLANVANLINLRDRQPVMCKLCKQLGEETWNTCVWERRAHDPNTAVVLGLMEQNKYEQAQQLLEKMMSQELERNQAKGQKMNAEYDTWPVEQLGGGVRACTEIA